MTTEQTAEQLELAAQILRTGHPWESSPQAPDTDIYSALRDGFKIRPILATPPDNRPLHNPNNLTAEQVGIGYRLMTLDEKLNTKTDLQTKWKDGGWCWCGEIYGKLDHKTHPTYRLPLSVPWSEPKPDPCYDEKKTVPFDISDVPPCSVLSLNPPRWFDIYGVCKDGIYVLDDEPLVETLWKWDYLLEKVKINRSIPLTGKWNPDAWEPCHKSISENG